MPLNVPKVAFGSAALASVQLAPVSTQAAGTVSRTAVGVAVAARVNWLPATATPAAVVLIVSEPKPLALGALPLKVKLPVPTVVTALTVRDAVADLGLPLVSMEQERGRLEDLFRDAPAGVAR